MTYDYAILGCRVVDGDTIDVTVGVDFGFHIRISNKVRVRLAIIDAPERGRPGYSQATTFLLQWLTERSGYLRLTSHKQDREHGRWIADVYDRRDGTTASEALLREGLAVVWSAIRSS